MAQSLINLRHPYYASSFTDWEKWRLTYEGGHRFRRRYLTRYNTREDANDFRRRLAMSYVPAFAKSAVNEVKNSIFQRLTDITRDGGPESYHRAMLGQDGGVDLEGSSMSTFIGREILPELLPMQRVGVYVDMPRIKSPLTRAGKQYQRPYVYRYKTEDILSWQRIPGQQGEPVQFSALLLRDNDYQCDDTYNLPYGYSERYRYLWLNEEGTVSVKFFNKVGDPIYTDGVEEVKLNIPRIPFVLFELTGSLLCDVADYQIALMNLCSSDLSFALKLGYPFYTEQTDFTSMAPYMKQPNMMTKTSSDYDPTATTIVDTYEKVQQIQLGASQGRRYPKGTERPAFIAPPTEPLIAAMAKETQIKNEIRELVMLAVSNLTTQRQSAESKDADDDGLEAGLSYIGTELQLGESLIAQFWADYEGDKTVPTVIYPENYSLLSEEQRRESAAALKELMPMVPSLTYRREVAKRIARVTIGSKVARETLKSIMREIDTAAVVMGDPADIEKDVTNGICDPATAATARGYPKGTAEKAEEFHARRLALIAEHQSKTNLKPGGDPASRGVSDASADPKAPTQEKTSSQKDHTTDGDTKNRTRGTTT